MSSDTAGFVLCSNNAVQNDYTDYHHNFTAKVEDFQGAWRVP